MSEQKSEKESIVAVSRYGGWAVDEFIEKMNLGFRLGNVVKYISRAGKKANATVLDDLRKAQVYLNREIERMEAAALNREIERLEAAAPQQYTTAIYNMGVPPESKVAQAWHVDSVIGKKPKIKKKQEKK